MTPWEGRFRTVLADPPWRFKKWSMEEKAVRGEKWAYRNGRSPYDVQDDDYLKNLPVSSVCAQHCTLLMWTTWPKLDAGMELVKAWGFQYKSGLPWLKMSRHGAPRVGIGYHTRSCSELMLIATHGNPPVPDPSDREIGVIFNPIGEHSRKPDAQYLAAEQYPGPYLEMFARPRPEGLFDWKRPGWVHTGNEVDGLDMKDALEALARERGSE